MIVDQYCEEKYVLLPNPAETRQVSLRLKNRPEGNYHIQLLSPEGKRLITQRIRHSGGTAGYLLQLPLHLAAGIYQVEISGNGAERAVLKLMLNIK